MTAQMTPQLPEKALSQDKSYNPTKAHRRQRLLYIFLPMGLCVLLMVGVVVIALSLGRTGTSGIADIMLSFLCLFPLILCLFPLYLILVVANVLLIRASKPIYFGLENTRYKTKGFRTRAMEFFDKIARKSADLNVRLAPLEVLFGAFERTDSHRDRRGRK